jgi:tRNA wybutosine-synthesizing protein 2
MPPFKRQLQEKLKHALSASELELVPSSFQRLGHIAIVRLKQELVPKKEYVGEAVLAIVPGVKTVCLNTKKIETEFRQPNIEFLVGENNLVVVHREHECIFRFDVTKLMWSMGNMNERKRMYEMVKPGEVAVDFFAGMGYWSIPIAKHAQPGHVYAIDANPDAIDALRENQKLNKIPKEKMTVIQGKCEEVAPTLGHIADRIIMGYLPAPTFALTAAFHTFKPRGGTLHYEGVCEEGKYDELLQDVRDQGTSLGWNAELLHAQPVKSMAPRKWHYVLDIKVTPLDWDEGSMGKIRKEKESKQKIRARESHTSAVPAQ